MDLSGNAPLPVLRLLLAVAAAYAVAAAFYPALRTRHDFRLLLLCLGISTLSITPFIVPAGHRVLRFLAALNSGVIALKLIDLHIGASRGRVPTLRSNLVFLGNWLFLVERKIPAGSPHERSAQPRRMLLAVAGLLACAAILALLFLSGDTMRRVPFMVEHVAKAATLFAAWLCVAHFIAAFARWCGFPVLDFSRRAWLANTPADFWRRYNLLVGQFLFEDVFKPVGGLRHPVRGTMLAFLASGILHEMFFTIAIGHVQGYQLCFFLLQGAGVSATMRLRPAGRSAAVGIAATIAFNAVVSVFFFASVANVLPFYARPLPSWLRGW